MNDTTTPRPNVATGAFMGFFVMVMGLLLTALQTNPTTLEGWLVALQPVVAFVIAYLAPAYQKAWAALIGAGLIPFVLLIQALVTAEVPFDPVFFLTCLVALVQAGVTGMVANTRPTPTALVITTELVSNTRMTPLRGQFRPILLCAGKGDSSLRLPAPRAGY